MHLDITTFADAHPFLTFCVICFGARMVVHTVVGVTEAVCGMVSTVVVGRARHARKS